MAHAAGIVAEFDALHHLTISAETVVGIGVMASAEGDPKPAGQIEVFDLHNSAPLTLGNPEITHLEVFHQNLPAVCGRPRATRLGVGATTEMAVRRDHWTEISAHGGLSGQSLDKYRARQRKKAPIRDRGFSDLCPSGKAA
jgi:hypothetical protein